jgi:hypothetical protein
MRSIDTTPGQGPEGRSAGDPRGVCAFRRRDGGTGAGSKCDAVDDFPRGDPHAPAGDDGLGRIAAGSERRSCRAGVWIEARDRCVLAVEEPECGRLAAVDLTLRSGHWPLAGELIGNTDIAAPCIPGYWRHRLRVSAIPEERAIAADST